MKDRSPSLDKQVLNRSAETHAATLKQISVWNICDERISIIEKLSNSMFPKCVRRERKSRVRIVKDEKPVQQGFGVIFQRVRVKFSVTMSRSEKPPNRIRVLGERDNFSICRNIAEYHGADVCHLIVQEETKRD